MPERARSALGAAAVVVKVAVVAHLDRLPGDRFAGEVKGPRTKVPKVRIEGEGVCPSEALQNSFPPCRFIKEPLQNMSFFLGCGDCTSQMPAITIG